MSYHHYPHTEILEYDRDASLTPSGVFGDGWLSLTSKERNQRIAALKAVWGLKSTHPVGAIIEPLVSAILGQSVRVADFRDRYTPFHGTMEASGCAARWRFCEGEQATISLSLSSLYQGQEPRFWRSAPRSIPDARLVGVQLEGLGYQPGPLENFLGITKQWLGTLCRENHPVKDVVAGMLNHSGKCMQCSRVGGVRHADVVRSLDLLAEALHPEKVVNKAADRIPLSCLTCGSTSRPTYANLRKGQGCCRSCGSRATRLSEVRRDPEGVGERPLTFYLITYVDGTCKVGVGGPKRASHNSEKGCHIRSVVSTALRSREAESTFLQNTKQFAVEGRAMRSSGASEVRLSTVEVLDLWNRLANSINYKEV